MAISYICPHCGHQSERPFLFSLTRQRIFSYIWDNPGCSTQDIGMAIYNTPDPGGNIIAVHLAQIRRTLSLTEFRMARQQIGNSRRYTYKIVYRPTEPRHTEGRANGPT